MAPLLPSGLVNFLRLLPAKGGCFIGLAVSVHIQSHKLLSQQSAYNFQHNQKESKVVDATFCSQDAGDVGLRDAQR
jgi:hypothetical protein